jgi:hypothetical protein
MADVTPINDRPRPVAPESARTCSNGHWFVKMTSRPASGVVLHSAPSQLASVAAIHQVISRSAQVCDFA